MESGTSKRYFKCGEIKNLSHFYKHPRMKDGHLNKCKTCTKTDVQVNRSSNIDHYREYESKRSNDLKRTEARTIYQQQYQELHPDKVAARTKVSNALRDGRLTRNSICECCGSAENVHAHHSSYSEEMWLVVTWLCAGCHATLHRAFEYKIGCWIN